MIAEIFILLAEYIVSFISSLLPASEGFPAGVATAFETLGGYVGILDPLVPIDTLRFCIGIVIALEIAILGFKTARWFFGHVPVIGGKGI